MTKKSSKVFALIIITLLIFSGIPSQKVFASDQNFIFGLGSVSGDVGQTVEVPVTVTIPANTQFGNGVGLGDFIVHYDQTKLNIVGLQFPTTFNFTTNTGTPILSSDWADQIQTTGTSGTTGFGFSPTPMQVSGTPTNIEMINNTSSPVTNVLAYLQVKIIANSSTPIAIDFDQNSTLVNSNFDPLATVFQNGQVTTKQNLTITSIETILDISVANGTSLENIGLPSTVPVTLSDQSKQNINVLWDSGNPTYTPNQAGIYMFKGTLENLPSNISNPSGLKASLNVVVAPPLSDAKDITGFTFAGLSPEVTGTISGTNITATVPDGTDVTALVPTITVSADATVSPASGEAANFSQPVTYIVKAQDNSTKTYTVTVNVAAPPLSSAKDITNFTFAGLSPEVTGTISGTDITATVPYGTNITGLVPTITVSADATVTPASGGAADFSQPVTYTVKAQDNSTKTYTVTVNVAAPPLSSAKDITSFKFAGLTPEVTGKITGTDITATVPAGTNVKALVPTITVSPKAAVSPASAAAQDFSKPVAYTVTAENGSAQIYKVTVTVAVAPPTGTGPSFKNVSLDSSNKVVTVVFDKSLYSNVTDLKSAITFTTNGTTYSALGVSDSVYISSTDPKNLIITFKTPLSGANNKIRIAANSLKDANGNVQTSVITTPAISGTIDECFIATAAFGSKYQTDVMLLRQFRDKFLMTNPLGRAFVKAYYHFSPPIARTIAGSVILKFITRVLLLPFVVVVYLLFHPVLLVGVLAGLMFMVAQRRRKRVLNE